MKTSNRLLSLALLLLAGRDVAAAPSCEARSLPQQATLVELYTSEGCDSCPPADRWLAGLPTGPALLAAAFHVDYWDRLGWTDRFGSAAHTARQSAQQRGSGARFVYTPQVLVNGRDWRRWPALPGDSPAATVQIHLQRDADERVVAQVLPLPGAPRLLSAWWARLEDDHASVVKAGENRGVTLKHAHVVRSLVELPPWPGGARTWHLQSPRHGEGGRAVRLLFVVADATRGLPLQAVQLAC